VSSKQTAKAQLELALQSLESADVLGSIVSYTIPGRDPVTATHGFVDIEQSVRMDESRLFQIGSQTKMFTAAALLTLQREGKLSLDDLVADYVTGVARPEDLTIRQLLTHTGGIGDSITFFDPPAGRRPDFDVSFENHLFLGRVAGEEFAPGSDWNYNNLGFVVLGQVVESASGQSLDRYTRKHILEPLRMTETFLGNLESYPENRMARGYFSQDGETVDTTRALMTCASGLRCC
jgi:D-alanyl-D-alanine carboxypeptidase